MSADPVRDGVWSVLHETADRPTPERVNALVRLINDEKAKSYNIGFHDGTRKVGPFVGHG